MRDLFQGRCWLRASTLVLLASLVLAAPVSSEIYRWTDSTGRVHFTQNLNQVPAHQRAAAEAAAKAPKGPERVQTYSPPARAASNRVRRALSITGDGKPGETYRVRVQRAGTSLRVRVRLNDQVYAPFIIDTGASDVVVPRKYVEELGVSLAGARTNRYSTANGVITAKLITLDSVALGGARVANVPAAVSDSMDIGLLGLSYFNRFNYQIDSANGIVTLVRNDLESSGLIRGGRSEADWRAEYAQLKNRIQQLEERRKRVPSSHSRAHATIKGQRKELERQYAELESEADFAKVPFAWRE